MLDWSVFEQVLILYQSQLALLGHLQAHFRCLT